MRKDPDREYMYSHYHLDWGENWIRTPRYGFPLIEPTTRIPERMVPFDKIRNWRLDGACVEFHLADRRIDCVWMHPERYIGQLRKAACVATPDFSVLPRMERADVIHNVSRSLRLGRRFQELVPVLEFDIGHWKHYGKNKGYVHVHDYTVDADGHPVRISPGRDITPSESAKYGKILERMKESKQ